VQSATKEMIKQLNRLGINEFDIDNIKNINMETFNNEENYFKIHNKYILLSFVSCILIDQGIITFR
jgi:hypothetical protein